MAKKTKAEAPPPQYSKDLAEQVQAAIRNVAHQVDTLGLPVLQVNWVPLISKNVESSGWRLLHPGIRKSIIIAVMTKSGLIDGEGHLDSEALAQFGNSN
jgi:hypothetical protein